MELVAVIKSGDRLIHDEILSALGESAGNHNKLPFTSAQFKIRAVGKMRHTYFFECLTGDPVIFGRISESWRTRCPCHHDYVHHTVIENTMMLLGDIVELFGQIDMTHIGNILPINSD